VWRLRVSPLKTTHIEHSLPGDFGLLKSKVIVALVSLLVSMTSGEVKLPRLVGDGMVLQRDTPVRIWGWASDGEKIVIHFVGSTYITAANKNGEWEVTLSGLKAGGPYAMQIDGSNSITISDVLVGDVWVCSGQSNMGLMLGSLGHVYHNEIEQSDNPFIRQFMVFPGTSFQGRETEFKFGKWMHANPQNVRSFTAVGYFFAKRLYEAYKVPIGLINASLGGSSTEAWISEESLKSFPKYHQEAERFRDPGLLKRINRQDDERVGNWNIQVRQNDEGYKDSLNVWWNPNLAASGWDTMYVPGYWADSRIGPVNGVVWFRREFIVPAAMVSKPAMLKLGRIVDADSVFIDGTFIGTTGSQYAERNYKVPANLLKEGVNTIVVRVINYVRHGGFVPGKQYELSVDDNRINLAGEWKYRVGATAEALEDRLFTGKIPTGLFNNMIAPMLPYRIKGVLWYQGESNTSRAFEHFELFKLLIHDWRQNWHQGDFPFVYAQLPNFVEVNIETTQYDWAYFRESQLKALSIPGTGMAVSIDIGEWNDIHPVDKMDFGYRLALAAQKVAYGQKDIVFSGPVYSSMKVQNRKAILSFSNVGGGLVAKNGVTLRYFEICGSDNKFFPAKAKIVHNTIVVWSDSVRSPVAVRYAWANNPEGANLYNKEGLPASPFRTSELY
jgi:sialate O-acetylesterase